jgi:pyrroloquinoline quinone (PQQ) biosynthesis protein C
MAVRTTIESILRALVKGHGLVSNGLIEGLRNERLSADSIQVWAQQQYFMSISLSQCFAALYARAPAETWRARLPLLSLMGEEAWGYGKENHGDAFLRFFRSIGGSQDQLDRAVPWRETDQAMRARLAICEGKAGYGLGASALALAFGNEHANLFLFAKLRGLTLRLFPHADTGYFDAHTSDEPHHNACLVAFAQAVDNAIDPIEAARATAELMDYRLGFFDAVARRSEGDAQSRDDLKSAAAF